MPGLLGAMLLACAGTDPAADRLAFRDLDCARIVDAGMRDDCVIASVGAAPETAGVACPGVVSAVMRDECWFTAVDSRDLVGGEAVTACTRAGRFVAQCHANAISREVSRLPPMSEAALTTEVTRIVGTFRRSTKEVPGLVRRRIGAVGEGKAE